MRAWRTSTPLNSRRPAPPAHLSRGRAVGSSPSPDVVLGAKWLVGPGPNAAGRAASCGRSAWGGVVDRAHRSGHKALRDMTGMCCIVVVAGSQRARRATARPAVTGRSRQYAAISAMSGIVCQSLVTHLPSSDCRDGNCHSPAGTAGRRSVGTGQRSLRPGDEIVYQSRVARLPVRAEMAVITARPASRAARSSPRSPNPRPPLRRAVSEGAFPPSASLRFGGTATGRRVSSPGPSGRIGAPRAEPRRETRRRSLRPRPLQTPAATIIVIVIVIVTVIGEEGPGITVAQAP